MMELTFEICYVEGEQNALSDYQLRFVGDVAEEQDEEDMLIIK